MFLAAEYTTATLAVWAIAAVAVGFVAGWLVRPWLVADRLREEYEDRLTDLQRRHDDTAAALEAKTAEHAAAKAELDAVRAEHARAEVALVATQERAAGLETQVADLATQKDAEIARLSAEAGKVGGLEVSLADRNTRLAARDARVGELEARVAGLAAELEEARRGAEDVRRAHEDCVTRLAERDARIVELEARAATAIPAAPGVASVPPAPPTREAAAQRVVEIAARTRGDAAIVDDDLQRVHGIGPVIERMLKEMGITSFLQIARLRQEEIADVAAALDAFPDRIDRDGWVASAARLHEETYGASP